MAEKIAKSSKEQSDQRNKDPFLALVASLFAALCILLCLLFISIHDLPHPVRQEVESPFDLVVGVVQLKILSGQGAVVILHDPVERGVGAKDRDVVSVGIGSTVLKIQ